MDNFYAYKGYKSKADLGDYLREYSNIIFTNGDNDPWRTGGVTSYPGTLDLPYFNIQGAAHHQDLILPLETDNESITWVRE